MSQARVGRQRSAPPISPPPRPASPLLSLSDQLHAPDQRGKPRVRYAVIPTVGATPYMISDLPLRFVANAWTTLVACLHCIIHDH